MWTKIEGADTFGLKNPQNVNLNVNVFFLREPIKIASLEMQ